MVAELDIMFQQAAKATVGAGTLKLMRPGSSLSGVSHAIFADKGSIKSLSVE